MYVQMKRMWVIAIAVDNQLRHRRIANRHNELTSRPVERQPTLDKGSSFRPFLGFEQLCVSDKWHAVYLIEEYSLQWTR